MAHSEVLEFKDISSEGASVLNVIDSFSADNLKIAILENGIVLTNRDEPSGAFR